MTTGKRLVLMPDGCVEIESFAVPAPGPDQIRVRVQTTQVSAGSEINGVRRRKRAPEDERGQFKPKGLGYNAIGEVDAVGSEIEDFVPGDRVLCGANHSSHWMVTPSKAQQVTAIPQEYRVEKVPVDLDLSDEQMLFAVLGDVALHGIRRARIQIGESVAVYGLGVVGLMAVQLARVSGAHPLIGVDLVEERMALARELGASHIVHAGEQDVVEEIQALTELPWRWRGALSGLEPGSGAEVQLHCTSYIGNYPTMLKAAADRGRIVLVGATSGPVEIESHELFRRELQVMGSYQTGMIDTHPYWPWTRARNQQVILDLIQRRQIRVDPLISHVVSSEEAPQLYERMLEETSGWLSVFFTWDAA